MPIHAIPESCEIVVTQQQYWDTAHDGTIRHDDRVNCVGGPGQGSDHDNREH